MIIAVAVNGTRVSQHFGHATHFTFFTIENNTIISQEHVTAPAHSVGNIPAFVAEFGAKVVLAGNMGTGAVSALERHNVKAVRGVSGDAQEAVTAFLAGSLTDSGFVCVNHDAHHGIDHGQGNGQGNGLRQGELDGHGQGPRDGHGRYEVSGRGRGLGLHDGSGRGSGRGAGQRRGAGRRKSFGVGQGRRRALN